MNLKLYQDENIRIETPHSGIFTEVRYVGYETLAVDLYGFQGYIEIRKRNDNIRVFHFPQKFYKKECDFGFWEDAEIVFSYNKNGKDKGE